MIYLCCDSLVHFKYCIATNGLVAISEGMIVLLDWDERGEYGARSSFASFLSAGGDSVLGSFMGASAANIPSAAWAALGAFWSSLLFWWMGES